MRLLAQAAGADRPGRWCSFARAVSSTLEVSATDSLQVRVAPRTHSSRVREQLAQWPMASVCNWHTRGSLT